MTPTDISNRNIIMDLIEKHMGYEDKSIAFFRNQLYTPFIDDAFKEGLGPDLRKRWVIDFSSLKKDEEDFIKKYDTSFRYFKTFFNSFSDEINYNEFLTNIKQDGKSKIKIKKYIEKIYENDEKRFNRDKERAKYNIVLNNINSIDEYIIKCFEVIGKYKIPNKKMELVLSLNFADWFLCSTAESWESCFSIDKGCYWFGVPSLIGDFSRALIYITAGNKKTYLGITVDSIISRSWVLLGENNKKYIVKFYPNNFISEKIISKLTGDSSYILADNIYKEIKTKNSFNLLFFKKKIAFTAYNDRSKILIENKKPFEIITNSPVIQAFNKFLKEEKINFTQIYLKSLIIDKYQFDNFINYTLPVCKICGKEKEIFYYDRTTGNDICEECFNSNYTKCEKCGEIYHKSVMKEFKGKFYDQRCYNKMATIKCEYCKKDVIINDTFNYNGKAICIAHKLEMKKCKGCGKNFFKEEMIKIHDTKKNGINVLRLRCQSCFNDLSKKIVINKCERCGEYYTENRKKSIDKICNNCKESKS